MIYIICILLMLHMYILLTHVSIYLLYQNRLVPGFDDQILRHTIESGAESGSLRALVLQLYGTGNAPAVKKDFINCLKRAHDLGILVVASTQCHQGRKVRV